MYQTHKTILIVCEGGGTESSYFESIRDTLLDKLKALTPEENFKYSIKILPMPQKEKAELFKQRAGVKRRELRKLTKEQEEKLETFEVEQEYAAQPTRYVRLAQMGLEDGSYEEAWAVYDKNGHPNHKEAIELANKNVDNKIVNIAFNSISFEHWILLHFEECRTSFIKSQCKRDGVIVNCGTSTQSEDCKGNRCVCGYLVSKGHFKDLKRKEFFATTLPSAKIAIHNACLLRGFSKSSSKDTPIYNRNPFTTTDRLIFRLTNLPFDFNWFEGSTYETKDFSFTIEQNESLIQISLRKLVLSTVIVEEGKFILLNAEGNLHPFSERRILDREEQIIYYDLKKTEAFKPIYIGVKLGDEIYAFTDLPIMWF